MTRWIAPLLPAAAGLATPEAAFCAGAQEATPTAWWIWPIALFSVTLLLGVVAILGGVGGGVLFVPIVILGIVVLILRTTARAGAALSAPDALSDALGLHGIYHDATLGKDVAWEARNTLTGLGVFAAIGVLAGLFGPGAGWANVPALDLPMGMPLKLAAGTSSFLLSVIDTSAAWIHLDRAAMLPMLVVPSCLGIMIGARIGTRLLRVAPTRVIRRTVIALLAFADGRALLKGLGLWT